MNCGWLIPVFCLLFIFAREPFCYASQELNIERRALIATGQTTYFIDQVYYKVNGRKLVWKEKPNNLYYQDGKDDDHVGDISPSRPTKEKYKRGQMKMMKNRRRFSRTSAMKSLAMVNMDYNHRAHHSPPVNNGMPPTGENNKV